MAFKKLIKAFKKMDNLVSFQIDKKPKKLTSFQIEFKSGSGGKNKMENETKVIDYKNPHIYNEEITQLQTKFNTEEEGRKLIVLALESLGIECRAVSSGGFTPESRLMSGVSGMKKAGKTMAEIVAYLKEKGFK